MEEVVNITFNMNPVWHGILLSINWKAISFQNNTKIDGNQNKVNLNAKQGQRRPFFGKTPGSVIIRYGHTT